MIRTVPTGDLGFDVLLEGGWRLVTRLPDRASATILLRGGPGVGKTLVGLQVALELAKALEGDVAVACVELLPTEYAAQIEAARQDLAAERIVTLPNLAKESKQPRIFCGLLTELDPEAPDLVANLEALAGDVEKAGGKPVAFIVDSLIEGYGIGSTASRSSADAVMKFAAERGCGLVLCEEASDGASSPWVFAADTVLELGVTARERGRWIEVRKHRFGGSVSGRHELDLGGCKPPIVVPEPHAWGAAQNAMDVLREHGWKFHRADDSPALVLHPAIQPEGSASARFRGGFVLVRSPDRGLARSLAFGLLPAGSSAEDALIVELDPLTLRREGWNDKLHHVHYLSTFHGPARLLRELIERLAEISSPRSQGSEIRRIVLGDLGLVLGTPEASAWAESVRTFASLVVRTKWGIPIIAYETTLPGINHAGYLLSRSADLNVDVSETSGVFRDRWRNWPYQISWSGNNLLRAFERLDQSPRAGFRGVD